MMMHIEVTKVLAPLVPPWNRDFGVPCEKLPFTMKILVAVCQTEWARLGVLKNLAAL